MTVPRFVMLFKSVMQIEKLDTQRIVTVRPYPVNYNQDSFICIISIRSQNSWPSRIPSSLRPPGCSGNANQLRTDHFKPFCHVKNNCNSLRHFFYSCVYILRKWLSFKSAVMEQSPVQGHFSDYEQKRSVHNQGLPHPFIRIVLFGE